MKKILSVLFLLVMISGGTAYAQDQAPLDTGHDTPVTTETPSDEAYRFPFIAPEGMAFGGYSLVNLDGSTRADEYEYLNDSVTLGGSLSGFHFPHRYHLDLDFRNKNDYFADVGYAYKDVILFRGINRTLYHNLDNILLVGPSATIDPNGAALAPAGTQGVYIKSADQNYGVKWSMSTVFLRFKTPDYPFHVFLDGSIIEKDGTVEQRFLGGAGSFSNIVRTSETRDLDWETKNLTVGTNAHLGPVEVEVSHGEKRFDPGGTNVLYNYYSAGSSRNEGIFAHNLVPDLKGSSNTLKIHTSYTGRLVASATFTKIDRENRDSNAKADYFIGAGEVTWTAATNLALFVKYRHKETDIDNPSSVTVANLSNPADIYTYSVRPSISSITDTASATARYRPISGLTLRAEYDYDHIRRENFEEWGLPEKTGYNTASLSADIRLVRNLNLRTGYTHKEINNPAYNVEPDHSDEGHATVSWTPIEKITTFLSYSVAKETRDDLNTVGSTAARNRDVNRDSVMGAVTYLLSEKVSMTASYTYLHDKIRQDIILGSHLEPFVPDTDMAHSYGLTVNYIPADRVSLTAGANYTISTGAFSLTDPALLQPLSVAALSELKLRETDCSVSGEYTFKKGFAASIQYRYLNVNDVLDNPWDDVQDGTAQIVLLTLSKRF